MKRSLVAIWFGLIAAVPVHAGPTSVLMPQSDTPERKSRPLNLRLVEDRSNDPSPIHNSGMIVQQTVAPNAFLGVGVFKMAPKKLGSGDYRADGTAPKSRRAAVSFLFKF